MSRFLNSSSPYNGGSVDGDKTSWASSSSTPPPPHLLGHHYDVFLSFKGETRRGFTDHLYKRLTNAGILVFRDKEGLPLGNRNWPELLKAIEASKISIPIISPNYASSKWCLDELVHILKCKNTFGQHVIPIFYQVKPSDVRKNLNVSEEELQVQKKRHHFDGTHIQEWTDALMEVSYMTGLESEKIADGYEGELVDIVVDEVSKALNDPTLDLIDGLVGVECHVENIMNMVKERSNDVHVVLIHGMGGIGKTTLANVIFNQLVRLFDCGSFLENIRENWSRNKEKVHLQGQLISNILGIKQSISRVDEGVKIIRDRFKYKKALIVLDDVDHRDQLNALARKRDWFGRGSIIIVTSRISDVLKEWDDICPYELKALNNGDSFSLFCKHAFKESHSIPNEFHTLAKQIVSTTGGLPLAIEVIGRYLRGEDDKDAWKKNLEKLKEIPDDEVQRKLRISFDALNCEEQEIFLDIACLPIHEKRQFAFYMWESCGYYPEVAIKKLVSMSLIKIGERDELIMHDQLRDLGREIVRQKSITNLGERSRLWKTEEAWKVIKLEQGTSEVQALNLWEDDCCVVVHSKQFEGMTDLRFLRMGNVCLEGYFKKPFSNLRWIESRINNDYNDDDYGDDGEDDDEDSYWEEDDDDIDWEEDDDDNDGEVDDDSDGEEDDDEGEDDVGGYSDITNINFLPENLVILEFTGDRISEYWDGWRHIKNLKVLELDSCKHLTRSPDFSVMNGLEVLRLTFCPNLKEIHPSIGKLSKTLKVLDVSFCSELRKLPIEVGKMEELRELVLTGTRIREIPISEGYMTKLEKLEARFCGHLTYIPDSLGSLPKLRTLLLIGCISLTKIPESIGKLKSLTRLDFLFLTKTECSLTSIEKLSNLRSLKFSGSLPDFSKLTNLYHLSYSDVFKRRNGALDLRQLYQLKTLKIYGSDGDLLDSKEEIDMAPGNISLLLELPSSLRKLELRECQTLRILPNLSNLKNLSELTVYKCSELVEINSLEEGRSLRELWIESCKKFSKLGSIGTMVRVLVLVSLDALERLPVLSTAKKLKRLEIYSCKSLVEIQGVGGVESLQNVNIRHCSSLERIDGLEEVASLTELILGKCVSIRCLPDLSKLTNLNSLHIYECSSLERIDGLIELASLEALTLEKCMLIRYLPDLSKLTNLKILLVSGCEELTGIQANEYLRSLEHLNIREPNSDSDTDVEIMSHEDWIISEQNGDSDSRLDEDEEIMSDSS